MSLPRESGLSKSQVSTGNIHADAIIARARDLPTTAEMAAHLHRLQRSFDAQRNTDLVNIRENAIADVPKASEDPPTPSSPPTALFCSSPASQNQPVCQSHPACARQTPHRLKRP